MTASAFFLILISGLAWSVFDLTRKRLTHSLATAPLLVWLMFGQVPVYAVWAVGGDTAAIEPGYWIPGSFCLAANIAANLLFLIAVRLSPLSLTIPMLSFSPVFTTLASFLILGEQPSALEGLGIALVVAGAFWLSVSSSAGSKKSLWEAFFHEKGVPLMVLVAALWAVTSTLDKASLAYASIPTHAALQCAGIGVGALLATAVRRPSRMLPGRGRETLVLLGAVTSAVLALGFQLVAVQETLVAFVETGKRAVGMTMSLVFGRLVFSEALSPRKVLAVALMGVGTGLILLS